MKLYLIALFTFCVVACSKPTERQIIQIVDYETLKPLFNKSNDTLYVINFWATWCKPCMEELPHFLEVDQKLRGNSKYKMLLVTLDKRDNFDIGVKATINSLGIKPDVYLLDDIKKMNFWINDIDPSWSGAIPATMVYRNSKQLHFYEGKLSKQELEQLINKYL